MSQELVYKVIWIMDGKSQGRYFNTTTSAMIFKSKLDDAFKILGIASSAKILEITLGE